MSDLNSLADRVESATGPDRELDNAIANATRLPLAKGEPPYTASLDAAMTLVPEGTPGWAIYPNFAEVHLRGSYEKIEGKGATPALALTAAALRAHQQSIEGRGE